MMADNRHLTPGKQSTYFPQEFLDIQVNIFLDIQVNIFLDKQANIFLDIQVNIFLDIQGKNIPRYTV